MSATTISQVLPEPKEVHLFHRENSYITENLQSEFAACRELTIRNLNRSALGVITYLPLLLYSSLILRWHLHKRQAKVLVLNDFYLMHGLICRLLLYRGRIVTWVRIDPSSYGSVSRLWLLAVRKSADQVISVSKHIQSKLLPVTPSVVVYDSLEARYENTDSRNSPDGLNFIYVANYIEGKGQDIAIQAFSKVSDEFPNATLSFFGGDMGLEKNRAFKSRLVEKAAKLGLGKQIQFGGFVGDPIEVLTGSFASLNFSRSESFSRTVLEASACGLPVVATRSGGPQEIIVDGQTGYLTNVDDIDDCARAMLKLCRSPEQAQEMGRAGRQRALDKFSQKAFLSELLAHLRPLTRSTH